MGIIDVGRITPRQYRAVQVVDANAAEVMGLAKALKETGRFNAEAKLIDLDSGGTGWRVFLRTRKGETDMVAEPGYWIVFSDDLQDVQVLTGPAAVAAWHQDVPLQWDSQVTVSTSMDGTAEIAVAQPTSMSGPFTYAATLDGQPVEIEPAVTLVKSPGPKVEGMILGASVTHTATGLEPGSEHTAVVSVTDGYGQTASSDPVTFSMPEPDPVPPTEPGAGDAAPA
ncbi:hypothetical protein MM1218R_01529 [Mycobacterium marinum]|uniref:hypothetical protein n=1 Tax=Mycobacterium marinum TaxID=1781 RepID=UPI000E28C6B3|nr:hypothetical protein [Mycobacterium marinum]AXN43477.1 hypothetical protein MM1218R_01529 [Mycobacterium marinum]RFZ11471.1 hypothetical protein DE4381_01059 [Mycobacterium marinum]